MYILSPLTHAKVSTLSIKGPCFFTDMSTVLKTVAGTPPVSINIKGKNEENQTRVPVALLMATRGHCCVTEWTGWLDIAHPVIANTFNIESWVGLNCWAPEWPNKPSWDMEKLLSHPKPSQTGPGAALGDSCSPYPVKLSQNTSG